MSHFTRGGSPSTREPSYATPKGPIGQQNSGPGNGGHNHGISNRPVANERPSGSVGLGGTNYGTCVKQGKH